MIEVKKLVKSFSSGDETLTVLKGLDLAVQAGEFLAITGRSGSGKSTLLYQMGLLDRSTSGQIIIDGRPTEDLTDPERTSLRLKELGYVFQDYALIPELTAVENVAVPLIMMGESEVEAKGRAARSLTRLGLGSRLDNLPAMLSGGEQQRVAIARALAHEPKILFADEPTANLDSHTAQAVLNAFAEIHKAGQTIVMVTHEPEYAALADRVLVLADGVIEKCG